MQSETVGIIGPRGSGKSYLGNLAFQKAPRAFAVESDFDEFNAIRFETYRDTVLYLERIGAFKNPDVPFRVSYTPLTFEYDLTFQLALEVQRECKNRKTCRTPYWHFLEEADRFGDPRASEYYDEMLIRGRHYGINLCWMCLQPFYISKDVRRATTKLIVFRQTEKSDVEWVAERVGDLAYELPNLPGPVDESTRPPFPFLYWDASRGARIEMNGYRGHYLPSSAPRPPARARAAAPEPAPKPALPAPEPENPGNPV